MNDPVNLNNVDFITSCMQFINVLVHSAEDVNCRVFLQQEFTNLGLEEFLKVSIILMFIVEFISDKELKK
jgi:hypothetical protein